MCLAGHRKIGHEVWVEDETSAAGEDAAHCWVLLFAVDSADVAAAAVAASVTTEVLIWYGVDLFFDGGDEV